MRIKIKCKSKIKNKNEDKYSGGKLEAIRGTP